MGNIEKRDSRIDILRALALFGIFIAHSQPPQLLFEIRNFDVTMMAFLMGASFYLSQTKTKKANYVSYVIKRFKRLIIPSWIFILAFILITWGLSNLGIVEYRMGAKEIIGTFGLLEGVTYLWIMGVFFMVAIVNPYIYWFSNKIKSSMIYFFLIGLMYILYTLLINSIDSISIDLLRIAIDKYVLLGMGYSIVAAFGIRLYKLSDKESTLLALIMFLLFLGSYLQSGAISIQEFKYPPTLVYISYGLFVSLGFYRLLSHESIYKYLNNKTITWISTNSLNLYLYHIISIYCLKYLQTKSFVFSNSFINRFIFMVVTSVILVLIEQRFKNRRTIRS